MEGRCDKRNRIGAGSDTVYGDGIAQIHNQVIGFAVQYGLPAALIFTVLLTVLLAECLRGFGDRSMRVFILVFLSAEITMIVHPLYQTRAHYLPIILLLGALSRRAGVGADDHDAGTRVPVTEEG